MKLKKHFFFSDKNQVWRILISDSEKLIIETRDVEQKQVYFHCIDLPRGKKLFDGLQLEEKYWIGIETIYKDIIFFHRFASPDMPRHKEIIAFDINTKKELWRDDNYSFLFVFEDKIYCSKQLFEGWKFYSLDFRTGELIEELADKSEYVNELREKAGQSISYDSYLFPVRFDRNPDTESKATKWIHDKINPLDIIGEVEYTEYGSLLLFNFHEKKDGIIMNRFFIVDTDKGKEIFTETLNTIANGYIPDSFFIYRNMLIMLKEKKEVLIYKIE
ncbi:MAG: DUF4905 domain-containing protein [bacterium]